MKIQVKKLNDGEIIPFCDVSSTYISEGYYHIRQDNYQAGISCKETIIPIHNIDFITEFEEEEKIDDAGVV